MDVREQIQDYLENPQKCYKQWYIEHTLYKAGGKGEEVGVLADWKKEFDKWVKDNRLKLREIICPNVGKIKTAVTQIDMVLEIMDIIEKQPYVGVVKLTAALLFLYGIERLCQDYKYGA